MDSRRPFRHFVVDLTVIIPDLSISNEELLQRTTKQPPAKAGGFELRTKSPDTRRLNDTSYSDSILKLSFGFGSKWCSKYFAYSSLPSSGPLSRRNTLTPQNAFPSTSSGGEIPQTDSLMFVLLFVSWSHSASSPADNSPIYAHDLTHYSLHNSDFKCFARLAYQLSNTFGYLSFQNLISILRYSYKMVFNLLGRMTSISVIYAKPPVQHILAAKADWLKPVVLTLW